MLITFPEPDNGLLTSGLMPLYLSRLLSSGIAFSFCVVVRHANHYAKCGLTPSHTQEAALYIVRILSLKWHKLRLWAPTEHIEHVLYAEQSIFTM